MARNPKQVIQVIRLRLNETTLQVFVMSVLLVLLIFFTGLQDRNFLSPFSLRNVARDVAIGSCYALGQAVVLISGGIDLSVGSLICFLGVMTCLLLQATAELPPPVIIAIVIMTAAAIGFTHGALVCWLKLQPFLVTLCSLLIFRGLARVATQDRTISFIASDHLWLRTWGAGLIGGVPSAVYVLIALLIPLGIFMHFTAPGRYLYAIGSNLEAARYSGVRIHTLRIFSYMVCSMLAAIAAILELGDVGSVPPSNAGTAYEMYGITAAVLGGCALSGGRGSLLGVVVGMAILRVIKSVVIFFGISTYWTFAVTGFVLLAAVIIDSLVRRQK